jgi:hypothetical protein
MLNNLNQNKMSTEKSKLAILVIDRSWKEGEKPVSMFEKYQKNNEKGYDVIIFPFTETKRRTEVIFFSYYNHLKVFQNLFNINIDYDLDGGDPFYDFDLPEIDEQAFYDILGQEFEVITSNLTDVEKQ